MRDIYRILDANVNRAAEGMRVLEDLARFMLDRKELSGQIKQCRHELRSVAPGAIKSRDVDGDVGISHMAAGENSRECVADIAIAAGNRCAEALRVIEELLKLNSTGAAIEAIRYRMYDHAGDVVLSLSKHQAKQWKCCFILTTATCHLPWKKTLQLSLDAGCSCIQIREKTMATNALIKHAKEVVSIVHDAGAAVIVNDRVDVAMAVDANGVHLGISDISVKEARRLCSDKFLIGATAHSLSEARSAVDDGADYLGIGPMFASETKPHSQPKGPSLFTSILNEYPLLPHLAIGGITPTNVTPLFSMNCQGVAVCDAIASSGTPGQVVHSLITGAMQPT